MLRECADAYLDPDHRIGVWRTQENGPPACAAAPELAHFWVPALWKYARATGDPRMPGIFKKYFAACYAADPFREDVGRYSDAHLGYAYYFTKDPRHLRPAQLALDKLLPNAQPLKNPKELGQRLYNPYAPIQSFTAVPRLLWALERAHKQGVEIPRGPLLRPQRAPIAFPKKKGTRLELTLWGFDRTVKLIGPDGKPVPGVKTETERHASNIQPFDRTTPEFEVFLHQVTVPAECPAGFYVLAPQLEMAVLDAGPHLSGLNGETPPGRDSARGVIVNAARPVSLASREVLKIRIPQGSGTVSFVSNVPQSILVMDANFKPIQSGTAGSQLEIGMSPKKSRVYFLIHDSKQRRARLWIRIENLPVEQCWTRVVALDGPALREFVQSPFRTFPGRTSTMAALFRRMESDFSSTFPEGRFGKALQVIPGRKLTLPDHVTVDGKDVRLFNIKQGTIEFFVKRQWDDRLVTPKPVTFLTNGWLKAWCPRPLPLREWAHVAVEWRPLKRDPERIAVHIYVDGLDQRNYRSTWWEGYSQKPLTLPNRERLRQFVCETVENAPFVIDELRISTVARYAVQNVELGGQQVFNPSVFEPPTQPFTTDARTAVLLHFDGNVDGESVFIETPIEGRLIE